MELFYWGPSDYLWLFSLCDGDDGCANVDCKVSALLTRRSYVMMLLCAIMVTVKFVFVARPQNSPAEPQNCPAL